MARNEYAIASTHVRDSCQAGRALGWQVMESLSAAADAVILFVSPQYDQAAFLREFKRVCQPEIMVGCSSAGEFTSYSRGEGMASVLAIRSSEMRFNVGVARGLEPNQEVEEVETVAHQIVDTFSTADTYPTMYRTSFLLADQLIGQTDTFFAALTRLSRGTHELFGIGAGDDACFQYTPVFCDTEVIGGGVVALEILSSSPIGIALQHPWYPASPPMLVTEARDTDVVCLDGEPALTVYQRYAESQGILLNLNDYDQTMRFLLNNLLGIDMGLDYCIRVPRAYHADGSVTFAGPIPRDTIVQIMTTSTAATVGCVEVATRKALQKLCGVEPGAALFFDCVGSRFRLANDFYLELEAIQKALGGAEYVGCNSHGQYARTEGQYGYFQNCNALVGIFPR